MRSRFRFSCLVLIASLFSLTAFAAVDAQLVATPAAIEWQRAAGHATVLSLQRPDGEVVTETFAADRKPMLRLQGLADGAYSYGLRGADGGTQSGSFTVAHAEDDRGAAGAPRPPRTEAVIPRR
jgi:hypothetical protein